MAAGVSYREMSARRNAGEAHEISLTAAVSAAGGTNGNGYCVNDNRENIEEAVMTSLIK